MSVEQAAGTAPEPGVEEERKRWLALYVLCTGMLMIVLDITVVNVALPTIQDDLGFSQSDLSWVVNAYLITFGGLLLLAGRLGDLIGRRTVFLAGLALFTAASLLCGAANSSGMLIGARFLQGIGGAMSSAVILGMIATMFPEPRDRAKAMGLFAFVASGGGTIGLLVGGVLTETISWHWIFLVNVPIAIVTALLALRWVERDDGIGIGEGADVPGAVLITSSLMLGVYTIVKPAAEQGWGAAETLLFGGVSLGLLALFLAREATAKTPLIPLSIFRARNLTGANLVQVLAVPGMFGMFFLGSLYLERVLGYDPLQIGLAFLPATLLMGILSARYTEPLSMRFGAKRLVIAGLILIGTAAALFTRTTVEGDYAGQLLPAMAIFGIGAGLAFPSLMTVAMSGVEMSEAGLASGLVNTAAQVGGAVGLAVLATVSASRSEDLIASGTAEAQALTDGYHLAFWIGVALVAAAIVVAVAVIRQVPVPETELSELGSSDREEASPAYSEAA
jgi:EmrB/QacA subfamily drug resistance transporter